MADSDVIENLAECYKNKNLALSILKETPELSAEFLREIQFSVRREGKNKNLTVIVFDEFKDVEIPNPVLWLHLILDACEAFEEAEDFKEWIKDMGYKDTAFSQRLYQQYSVLIPEIRKILGREVKAVDSYHVEFNTSIAQALRAYKL